MKKILSMLIMISIFVCLAQPAFAETLFDTANSLTIDFPEEPGENADLAHEKLMNEFDNELLVCALMGNFAKESRMDPRRWEGDDDDDCAKSAAINKLFNEDIKFPTRESRYYFSTYALLLGHDGFGLAQWTAIGRKIQLYDFAVSQGKDITDLEMQLDFVIWEMLNNYSDILDEIEGENRLDLITVKVASRYERTHAGDLNMAYRLAYAKYYYEYYTGKEYIPEK